MDKESCIELVDEFISEQVTSVQKMGSSDCDDVLEAWNEIKRQID